MAKITFEDKIALTPQPSVADVNKCTDANINEIKASVNALYDELSISQRTATIDVSTTAVEINTYAKYGKIASVKLVLTITNQISANATTQIAHSLPVAPENLYGVNGWEFFAVSKNDKSNIRCRIDKNGVLSLFWLNNVLPAETQIYFYTTYITN